MLLSRGKPITLNSQGRVLAFRRDGNTAKCCLNGLRILWSWRQLLLASNFRSGHLRDSCQGSTWLYPNREGIRMA